MRPWDHVSPLVHWNGANSSRVKPGAQSTLARSPRRKPAVPLGGRIPLAVDADSAVARDAAEHPANVGDDVGAAEGAAVGPAVGAVGASVGAFVGATVGTRVGACVGAAVDGPGVVGAVEVGAMEVGPTVGTCVGTAVVGAAVCTPTCGAAVGATDGTAVGAAVGAAVGSCAATVPLSATRVTVIAAILRARQVRSMAGRRSGLIAIFYRRSTVAAARVAPSAVCPRSRTSNT
mmetsp:Transcript_24661/g.73965  ORF Transcript_24661/g.73965 Transcript_24661/m.73965 type:complete len:233 (+) Transcript_24661:4962-5660(+)